MHCATLAESSVHDGCDPLKSMETLSKLCGISQHVASQPTCERLSCKCRTPVTAEPSTSGSGRQPPDASEDRHIAKLTDEQLQRNHELVERLRGKLVSYLLMSHIPVLAFRMQLCAPPNAIRGRCITTCTKIAWLLNFT